ncbi:hypothetical protein J8J14_16465 [Roseomonas sp. SSH11]|uniref:DUF4412 domain-containing protein n=1 Tax=Pararoseomonas baculiformis TaxID=2820812 RepID=A0ABS4AH65_9PROT|nr:hypothetical protein [Pararoseomonas baculiformis]MBP0446369.1 hypothetical protein [Pararoseomonas baculiformis]
MRHALPAILVLALTPAGPAAAQEQPLPMPTRDVAVTYQVPNTRPSTDSVAWKPSEGLIRTEGRAMINRVTHLIDTRSGSVTAVVDADRSFHHLGRMASVMTQEILPVRPRQTRVKEGTDTIAGQPCTIWRIEEEGDASPEEAGHACITADGVPLRLVTGSGPRARTRYVATQVTYEAQDPARFRVPAGYQPLTGR